MNKVIKNIGLSILSVSLVILSTYGAGTIIKNLTQTATTGDIISSEWVNAVNTNLNQTATATTGGGVSCILLDGSTTANTFVMCIWSDGICRKIAYKVYNAKRQDCGNALN